MDNEFKACMERYRRANDRMVDYFKESESYEEWLLECKADGGVSDYIGFMISMGMKDERDLYLFLEELKRNPETNIMAWTANLR